MTTEPSAISAQHHLAFRLHWPGTPAAMENDTEATPGRRRRRWFRGLRRRKGAKGACRGWAVALHAPAGGDHAADPGSRGFGQF